MPAAAILLIAPEATADPVATALRKELDAEVRVAPNRRAALALLNRHDEYAVLVLEEGLSATDPEAADHLYKAAGGALLLEINFALTGTERVLRQVRAALIRRTQDRQQARASVAAALQSEFASALAGLLLESELALREAPPAQQPKLRHVVELASGLRDRLRA